MIVSEITKRYYKNYDLSQFEVILANKQNYKDYVPKVDYIIAGREEYTLNLLESNKDVVISRCGHGTDNIAIKSYDCKGALNTTIAEITIGYMIMTLRNIIQQDKTCRQGVWKPIIGNTLKDHTVGIIGYGNIGKEVAKLLKSFGCTILHYDIVKDKSNCRLNTLLSKSDIITLHCDKNLTSVDLIDDYAISSMKDGVILINTARGGIVNEMDLLKNIKKFKYVVLDVFEKEPLYINNRLRRQKNILLGCHSANATEEGWRRMTEMAIRNIINHENSLCNSSKI